MGRNKTGLTENTKKRLLLGAGAIFKNFVVGVDTYETSKSKIIAATQGGNTFEATPNTHNIQIDGILGVAADLDVIDSWSVSLECNFIETSVEVLKRALGASVVDTESDNAYDIIQGDTEFKPRWCSNDISAAYSIWSIPISKSSARAAEAMEQAVPISA